MHRPENTWSRALTVVCVVAFLVWLPLELLRGVIPSESWHTLLKDQAFGNIAQALGALGAVLAIVGSAVVTRLQIRAAAEQTRLQIEASAQAALESDQRTRMAATAAALNNARTAIACISAELELVNRAMPGGDLSRLTLHKFRLIEFARLARVVQLEHLPIGHQSAVLAASALAAGLLGCLEMVLEAQDPQTRTTALLFLGGVAEDQLKKMAVYEADIKKGV